MTREQLIKTIDENEDAWSCPEYACDMPEKEGNTGECCLKCAEKQLKAYEDKIRAEAIEPIMCGIDDFRTLERKMCKYFNEVDIHKEKDDLERLALDIVCHGMQTIGCLIQELDLINYQAREQKDE